MSVYICHVISILLRIIPSLHTRKINWYRKFIYPAMMTLKITTAPIAIPKSILCCFIIFKTEINSFIFVYTCIYTLIYVLSEKKKSRGKWSYRSSISGDASTCQSEDESDNELPSNSLRKSSWGNNLSNSRPYITLGMEHQS